MQKYETYVRHKIVEHKKCILYLLQYLHWMGGDLEQENGVCFIDRSGRIETVLGVLGVLEVNTLESGAVLCVRSEDGLDAFEEVAAHFCREQKQRACMKSRSNSIITPASSREEATRPTSLSPARDPRCLQLFA